MIRAFLGANAQPLRVVRTKYGLIGVRVWSENRINVEIRQEANEPFIVNRVQYLGTFTLRCPTWGTFELVGRITSWGGTQSPTPSAQRKILDEVGLALSKEDWIEAAFVMADRRDVNNEIIRADKAVEDARRALAAAIATRTELIRKEKALGGQLPAETGEPAA